MIMIPICESMDSENPPENINGRTTKIKATKLQSTKRPLLNILFMLRLSCTHKAPWADN